MAPASVELVFAYLDDPKSLSSHMSQASIMMMGSTMSMDVDAAGGRMIGSKIQMHGSLMGLPLLVEEVITERHAPNRKVWETIGNPRLQIMSCYELGFELTSEGDLSQVRIFINYDLPATRLGSWLGWLLGGLYARWCIRRMADDAVKHFAAVAVRTQAKHWSDNRS